MSASSFVYKSMEFVLGLQGETSKSGTTSEFGDAATEGLLDQPQVGSGSLRIVRSSSRERTRPNVYISMKDEDNDFYDFGYYLKVALTRENLWVSPTDPNDAKELPGQARASIIVLSDTYISSDEHLDELLEILDEMRNSSHFVLPIFYRVDPSRIRENGKDLLLQSFEGFEKSLRKVDQWHEALILVSNLPNVFFPSKHSLKSRTFLDDDDMASIKEAVSIIKYVSTRFYQLFMVTCMDRGKCDRDDPTYKGYNGAMSDVTWTISNGQKRFNKRIHLTTGYRWFGPAFRTKLDHLQLNLSKLKIVFYLKNI
ncbi:hypothetical protein M8C21_003011 [Ambrosia artemisiifolia]|uniref:ADP-ribosyl cyclase/cyclic ADP-ribose hydrolase n=1 Tax=Ambrosia artemisiifolia TaxID=4212 RepID=A0AAD5CAI1_AMBAR|nr:hypothetical protein M8C21_003011 [Ambrosia artemisiifolia]